MGNFDWRDYLNFSGELLTGQANVTTYPCACWRTIVSRSYYAAFHMAIAYCKKKEGRRWRDGGIDGHERVRQWFLRQRASEDEKEIGFKLLDLKIARHDADYKENRGVDKAKAEWAHARADEIVGLLRRMTTPTMPPAPTAPLAR